MKTDTMTTIARVQVNLLSHFFVNLNKASIKGGLWGATSSSSQMSDVWFARFVGSLADSLPYTPQGPESEGVALESFSEVV